MYNTVAVNYAACIKQEAHWGYDKFHNICTGTWNSVNWGSMDWTTHLAGGVMMVAALAAIATVAGVFIYSIVEDFRFYRS